MIYNRLVGALLLALPVLGFLIEFLLRKARLRGYGHIAGDVRVIAKAIKGELDRDFGDLLIRGSMNSTPVLIRISNSDQRPGLNIQVPAATNRSLYCVPKEHDSEGGQAALTLSDPHSTRGFASPATSRRLRNYSVAGRRSCPNYRRFASPPAVF